MIGKTEKIGEQHVNESDQKVENGDFIFHRTIVLTYIATMVLS